MELRDARPEEYAEIGDLTVRAYEADGPMGEYVEELRDAEDRAKHTDVIVAVDEGRIVGSVAYVGQGGPYAEVTRNDDEAEFRMLAVDVAARGRGAGLALVEECLLRARTQGKRRLLLCTMGRMKPAQRMYDKLGFVRAPDRDWSPRDGIDLIAYSLDL